MRTTHNVRKQVEKINGTFVSGSNSALHEAITQSIYVQVTPNDNQSIVVLLLRWQVRPCNSRHHIIQLMHRLQHMCLFAASDPDQTLHTVYVLCGSALLPQQFI